MPFSSALEVGKSDRVYHLPPSPHRLRDTACHSAVRQTVLAAHAEPQIHYPRRLRGKISAGWYISLLPPCPLWQRKPLFNPHALLCPLFLCSTLRFLAIVNSCLQQGNFVLWYISWFHTVITACPLVLSPWIKSIIIAPLQYECTILGFSVIGCVLPCLMPLKEKSD